MLPTPHSIELTLDDFQELVKDLAAYEYEYNQRSPEPKEVRAYQDTYWNGGIPRADSEICTEFQCYRERARADENLFSSQLQLAWVPLLRSFHKADCFKLTSLLGAHPLLPQIYGYGTDHQGTFRGVLRDSSLAYLDRFFEATLLCLLDSHARISTLWIECELAQAVEGWHNDTWRQFNLEDLRSLHFNSFRYWDEEAGVEIRDTRILNAIDIVVSKCSASLEELLVDRPVEHPTNHIIADRLSAVPLHRLHSLTLNGIALGMPAFAQYTSRLPALRKLDLYDCCVEPRDHTWRPLFDAIQRRPGPFHLIFYSVWGFEDNLLSFDLNTATKSFDKDVGNLKDEVDKSLFRYLAKRGSWDDQLHDEYEVPPQT